MIPLFKVAMSPHAAWSVADTLASGWIGQGPKVEAFEQSLSSDLGMASAVTVNSGTSALTLALALAGVGPGDEVISTPMTCAATNTPILRTGATIVWADVDPRTGLIDPADVARKISPRTKAIVAVDWGGHACDYAALGRHGVPVIEDAAHRLTPPAVHGDYVAFSFQAIKFLTTGDGGALMVPPAQLERARLLRWYGLSRACSVLDQDLPEAGFKFHMNDVAASIGLANIEPALVNRQRQQAHARQLAERLDLRQPTPPNDDCWLFTVLVDDRPGFIRHMSAQGIETSPVHKRNDRLSAFANSRGADHLPGVDEFDRRQVNIPVHWALTAGDIEHIATSVRAWGG
jgi:dTDP-4-amino-4,6-dideoxygalactose transaminase